MGHGPWTRRAGRLAARFGYFALVAVCGAAALVEGLRIGRLRRTAEFLSGPGGYIMILGVVLLLFAAIELAAQLGRTARRSAVGGPPPEAGAGREVSQGAAAGGRRRMQLTFVMCVVYVLLVRPLGFTLASLLYLTANLLLLGNRPAVMAATVAVVFVILRFGAPAIGLYLPRGLLGF